MPFSESPTNPRGHSGDTTERDTAHPERAGEGGDPQAESWLPTSPPGELSADDPTEPAEPVWHSSPATGPVGMGQRLGDYVIQGLLGKGGMGFVYEAKHVKLGLLVAIKMIDAKGAATPSDVERFVEEARAVAKLHRHPNIVKVYNISDDGDYPYFVMQLIRGGSLKDRLQQFRADPNAAAALMVKVAGAIADAHKKGILHRDLKPDNILIDEEGTPYVTDFGLVKRVDPTEGGTITIGLVKSPRRDREAPTSQTGFESTHEEGNSILGTPSFMPIEQAEGRGKDVSTLSDVYGLGATLFALLAGRAPFEGSGVHDILQKVISAPTPSPRGLNPKVSRDLDAICLKCLARDPKRRYESAEALARDLKRYLDGKPVHARPLPFWGRAARRVHREPLKFAAAASALAIVGLVGLIVLDRRENTELQAKMAAQEQLESLRKQLADKKDEIQKERSRLAEERTDHTLFSASQAVHDIVEKFEGRLGADLTQKELRQEMLQAALAYFKGFIADHGVTSEPNNLPTEDSPARRLELAKAHRYAADLAWRLDAKERDQTERNYQRAIEILEELFAEIDHAPENTLNHEGLAELGTAHHEYAIYLADRGNAEAAREQYLDGLEIRERLPELCSVHETRACGCEGSFEDRTELARSHGYLGDRYLADAQLEKADESYQTSHRIREKLFMKVEPEAFGSEKSKSERWKATIQLARSYQNLALTDRIAGDSKSAIQNIERGIKLLRELMEVDGSDYDLKADLAHDLQLLAELRAEDYKLDTALKAIEESIAISDDLAEQRPGFTQHGIDRVASRVVDATMLFEGGRAEEASAICERIQDDLRAIRKQAEDRSLYRQNRARCNILLGRIALERDNPKAAREPLSIAGDDLLNLLQDDPKNSEYLSDQAEAWADLAQALGPEESQSSKLLAQAVATQQTLHDQGFQSRRFEARLRRFREMQSPQKAVASGPH